MKEWLIQFPKTSITPEINLVCFPFAGGGTLNYSKWRKDLDQSIGLYAINLPGRERFISQPCLTNYRDLIRRLADTLQDFQDIPLIFFGHSYGGLTAWLTMLELQRVQTNKTLPKHLFISARVPPLSIPNQESENLGSLDLQNFKKILIERYKGIPQALLDSPAILDFFMPMIHNDFKLYEQYPDVMKDYTDQRVACDITTIGYSEDFVQGADFSEWKNFTKYSHQHLQLPGGHFEITNQWKPVTDHINRLKLLNMYGTI